MASWMQDYWKYWTPRLVLGTLLLAWGELAVWRHAHTYSVIEWGIIVLIYLALAAILLDLIFRWRLQDKWWGYLLVGGVFGILQNMLIALDIFEDVPASLIFYATGLETAMFLLAMACFRFLYRGQTARFIDYGVAAAVGVAVGVWTRWYPEIDTVNQEVPALDLTLSNALIALVFAAVFALALPRAAEPSRRDWMLSPMEWTAAGGLLLVVFLAQLGRGDIDPLGVVAALVTLIVLLVVLWYTGTQITSIETERDTFFFNLKPPFARAWALVLIPFTLAYIVGYEVLPSNNNDPLQASILFIALAAFGALWLPLIFVFIGIQTFTQLVSEEF